MQQYLVRELTHYCNISVPHCEKIAERVIPYYDFTYVLEGSMTYVINGKDATLSRNDAIFLPPGTRRARRVGTEPVRYVSFNFHLIDGITLPFDCVLRNCITDDTRRLFNLFAQQHLSPKFHSEQKCVNLLNYILFELLDSSALGSQNVHVIKILRYIEENPSQAHTLRSLSALVGLTPEYAATVFKRETGKTVSEYVNERRLLLAKGEICNTKRPLTEIAADVGFANYHYFARLFKKHFDTTPTKMRKRSK